MLIFRTPIEGIERPQMPADVVIVGGGPAGMACALRLSQLIDAHNAEHSDSHLSKENVYVLEKARDFRKVLPCQGPNTTSLWVQETSQEYEGTGETMAARFGG